MSFIFGGIAVGNPFEPVVLFLAVMTMCVDLGEEIAADSLDVEGDRQSGSRSLAIMLGADKAMRIAAAVFALVSAGSAAPFVAGWFGWMYLPPIIAFDDVVAYWMVDDNYDGSNFIVRQLFFYGGTRDEFAQRQKCLSTLAKTGTKRKDEKKLKIEINEEAFDRLYGFQSHPIPVTPGRKITVRVISQFGEESMKVLGMG